MTEPTWEDLDPDNLPPQSEEARQRLLLGHRERWTDFSELHEEPDDEEARERALLEKLDGQRDGGQE